MYDCWSPGLGETYRETYSVACVGIYGPSRSALDAAEAQVRAQINQAISLSTLPALHPGGFLRAPRRHLIQCQRVNNDEANRGLLADAMF